MNEPRFAVSVAHQLSHVLYYRLSTIGMGCLIILIFVSMASCVLLMAEPLKSKANLKDSSMKMRIGMKIKCLYVVAMMDSQLPHVGS